jgi:hypothetical protein
MLNAGQRPQISNQFNMISRDPISLRGHTSSRDKEKEHGRKKTIDIYSYPTDIPEMLAEDEYAWVDPPEDIYTTSIPLPVGAIPSPVKTQLQSSNANKYLTPLQFQWWGILPDPPLIKYHEDMLLKEKEEKIYLEKLQSRQWLNSLKSSPPRVSEKNVGREKGERESRGNATKLEHTKGGTFSLFPSFPQALRQGNLILQT